MRENFPHKKTGDPLSAEQVNKTSHIARQTGTPWPGAYMHGRPEANMQDEPFFMTTVEVVEDEDAPIYEIRERYYDDDVADPADAQWKTEPESETAGPWDLDATEPNETTFAKGDKLTAWWHPQRGMFLPIGGIVGGGTIRFAICEACCNECWADVAVLSRPVGSDKVIGEGATETECASSSAKILDAGKVRVYDKLGCFLNEPDVDLVGRKGYATYLEVATNPANCGDAGCAGAPDKAWEIISLCCFEDTCSDG